MKKKINLWISWLMITGMIFILETGCKKESQTIVLPHLSTTHVLYTSSTEVTSGGTITDNGGAAVTSRGVCWSVLTNPTVFDSKTVDGSGSGDFSSNITGLNPNTTYYLRAYATNSAGTAYGNQLSIRTWHLETVLDIDNNAYHVVTIGTQDWLVENLRVTHYSNGEEVPGVTDNSQWEALTTGAYCNYDNQPANAEVYGRLYNWFAVNDGRGIAPAGWHVPSDAEWSVLTEYLGGEPIAGNKLKEAGTAHWYGLNGLSTNETGFTALPGGGRNGNGVFDYIEWGGKWWTSTSENDPDAWIRYMDHGSEDVWHWVDNKLMGRSIRCVRD